MNVRLLIDSIVRETMVLIAQLATSGGLRAPLAHVAGQAFLELARELEEQGVTKKVTADMFGMALRTYQRRTQRLSQSQTDRGRSLWEAVYGYLEEQGSTSRQEVFRRFRHDDEASVRGVLRDLTESGLVFTAGSGRATTYRVASSDELATVKREGDTAGREAFVWSVVYRDGPLDSASVAARCQLPLADVDATLTSLVDTGRVERVESAGQTHYRSRELVIGLGDPAGWEASVLDHFSAVVRTVTRKLSVDQRASSADEVGGSTYHFSLWRGHPAEEEVLGELHRFRKRMSALRDRIDAHNRAHSGEPITLRVDAYYGQSLTEEEREDSDDLNET